MSLELVGHRSPTVEKILVDLREKIFLGLFKNNASLPESALAEEYGVSRGTIRTVLQVLESEGLIIVGSNGRKTPVPITEKFLRDIYDTRIMLEMQAIKICLAKEELDSSLLATSFADFYKLYSYEGKELYLQRSIINSRFHRAIILTSENVPLLKCWNTVEPLVSNIAKYNYIKLGEKQTNSALVETHQLLMDCILKQDEKALEILELHIGHAVDETHWVMQEE